MPRLLLLLAFQVLIALPGIAATFGTVTTVVGSVSDLVLDEGRRRLYLVNANANRVEIFSLPPNPIRQVTTITTDTLPLAAALSPDQRLLYVVCYNSSTLNIIDLEQMRVVARPNTPARPEGVAVGNDGRVLITTIGTGAGNSQNTLLVYDPDRAAFDNVVVVPPAPSLPPGAPPAGRAFLSNRSQLVTTPDGAYIIGVNIPNNNNRVVFVYEVASGTILRSRVINNISSVLAISPDGRKFMSGLNLIDTETLEVLAQQNLANAPYPIQPNTNFNTQQNQGGSVFSPDGLSIYSAFNVAPVQVPAARPNVGQLMVNDPDNLLIHRAYQMPENLAGKMVITSDGATVYAISESGFTAIPVGAATRSPILELSETVVQLANDQCGVTENQRRLQVQGINMGAGRVTATAQVLQLTPTGPAGLGGVGGPGGGAPGGGVVIIVPPVGGGGVVNPGGPAVPGQAVRPTNNAIFQSAPTIRAQNTASGPVFDLTFNNVNTRSIGTVSPVHDFLVQSNEAINIPPRLRVFQNYRNAESPADVRTVPVGVSANEGVIDIAFDSTRRRIYMANSGMNRVEVFDTRSKEFEQPIKVGQLPRSLAISPDGNTMYVANSGSESITVIDLNEGQVTGKLRFPPLPFNATAALLTPSVIAATQRGVLVVMNNGSLWKSVGNELIPRAVSPLIGAATVQQPRTMASTPNGEFAILLAGNGFVYLYDSASDEFVAGRQIFTNPIQGYYGPISAGPNGRYFLVNGTVLNPALTPIASAGTVVTQGGGGQQTASLRPIAAVAPLSLQQYVRFAQPTRANATQVVTAPPVVEVANATTGATVRQLPAVEGPISIQTGNARVNVNGRQIVVDPVDNTAYLITASGLSIVPLEAPVAADRPVFNAAGVVNSANGKTTLAPGSLITINGRGLGADATSDPPYPTRLGGVCVTLNNRPLPLAATTAGEIRAQIPPDIAAGRFPLIIRNIDRNVASVAPVQITLTKYAPAVVVDPETKQAAIFHDDGRPVNRQNPTTRDERLTMLAVGLGATKEQVPAGQPAPEEPLAITDPVSVFFGDPRYREAAIVVEWSGLAPGLVGVYQISLYVPGDRIRGEDLPVTIRIGGISSPTGGEMDPKVTVR
jgi:uncharacterized protein (TIGR03437 family)